MLEHVPSWLGELLKNVRAGHAGLTVVQPGISTDRRIDLSSPAFGDGTRLPPRFTADGDGISPPLVWGDVPDTAAALALIVEDPDAPAPHPLVHALLWAVPRTTRSLAEGALSSGAVKEGELGRNSYLAKGWLPPDPPTGHGAHDYVFQIFALRTLPELDGAPGRSAFLAALEGNVMAAGLLVATYSRGEEADIGVSARMASS